MPAKSPEFVHLAGRRRVGHRLRLDEVLLAQAFRRHAELARGVVDRALDQIGGLRTAGATIGVDRHRVGVGGAQAHMRGRDVVDAGRHADAEPRDIGREAVQVGAHVGDDVDLQTDEAVVGVEREPRGRDVVAALAVGKEMLGTVRHPVDRLAGALGRHGRERVFAVGEELGAEAAADVVGDDTHALGRQLHHHAADDVADHVAALAAERQGIAIAVVFGDDAAGVHVVCHQPLIDDGRFDHARGLREGAPGGGGVARLGFEGEIALSFPRRHGAVFQRIDGADDVRQRLPVDGDRFRRVLGPLEGVGDHEGDGVAYIAHHVARQHQIGPHVGLHARQHAEARHRREVGDVGAGEHQAHARHGAHAAELVDGEAGVGVRRAHHHRLQRIVPRDVGDVATLALEQRGVFLAGERLTYSEFHGGDCLYVGFGPARLSTLAATVATAPQRHGGVDYSADYSAACSDSDTLSRRSNRAAIQRATT